MEERKMEENRKGRAYRRREDGREKKEESIWMRGRCKRREKEKHMEERKVGGNSDNIWKRREKGERMEERKVVDKTGVGIEMRKGRK